MYRMNKCYWCYGVTCHLAKGCFAFATLWLVWDFGLVGMKVRGLYEYNVIGATPGNKWITLPERSYILLIIAAILATYDIGMMIAMRWEKRRMFFLMLTSFPVRISIMMTDVILTRIYFTKGTDTYVMLVEGLYVVLSLYFAIVAYSYYLEMLDPPMMGEFVESESVIMLGGGRRTTDSQEWNDMPSPARETTKLDEDDLRSLDPAWAAVLKQREEEGSSRAVSVGKSADEKEPSQIHHKPFAPNPHPEVNLHYSGGQNVQTMRMVAACVSNPQKVASSGKPLSTLMDQQPGPSWYEGSTSLASNLEDSDKHSKANDVADGRENSPSQIVSSESSGATVLIKRIPSSRNSSSATGSV